MSTPCRTIPDPWVSACGGRWEAEALGRAALAAGIPVGVPIPAEAVDLVEAAFYVVDGPLGVHSLPSPDSQARLARAREIIAAHKATGGRAET